MIGLMVSPAARADAPGECHAVAVDFVPAPDLQLVAWIEDGSGAYVDTAFITQQTGTYGLGNRPGRFDFNSGPKWPYGRRITTFPVWSHAHGMTFPEVDYQDGADSDLSHSFAQSSTEPHFCRPLQMSDPAWDTGTCASKIYTDKGILSKTATNRYPPRVDITRSPSTDTADVTQYPSLNPFDAVSQATPPGDVAASFTWSVPQALPDGAYTLVVEASQEFDHNATYSAAAFPAPKLDAFGDYGEPYRGQPSVVYRVPVTIGSANATATTDSYAGYGDPAGLDGNVRPPDSTITTGSPHSGASRLALTMAGSTMYRLRAQTTVQFDAVAPAAVARMTAVTASTQALVTWSAPGDDGTTGQVEGYDIRISAGEPLTAANFAAAQHVPTPSNLAAPGSEQQLQLTDLLPDTDYYVGVEGLDDCHNIGPLQVLAFHTGASEGEVDACFIATAAYGSLMANDVTMLRRFRDVVLKQSVLGELVTESYYTFGPPVAHVVAESDLLRQTARDALAPIVDRVRGTTYR